MTGAWPIRRLLALAGLLLAAAAAGFAQDDKLLGESESMKLAAREEQGKVLKGNLTSVVVRKRSAAPMVLEAQFEYAGRSLLEGRLELTFRDANGTVVGRLHSQELALTTGRQAFRLMAPAMPAYSGMGQLLVGMRFEAAKRRSIFLGEMPVPAPDPSERSFVMCLGETMDGGAPNPEQFKLAQSLRLERFDPAKNAASPSDRHVATSGAYLAVDDFPVTPLPYCQYDMVFLPAGPFSLLRERQLDALRRWVEAGGTVCLFPGRGMKEHHVRFLNALTEAPEGLFRANEQGEPLAAAAFPRSGIGLYSAGLGRAAIILKTPNAEKELDTPEWRRVAAFLWRIRAAQMKNVMEKEAWATDQQLNTYADTYQRTYGRGAPAVAPGVNPAAPATITFSPGPIQTRERLIRHLMPQTIRIIPFDVVVTMLVVFLVVIGPLDYVVLGLLGRRKYTWAFLPVACVAFTLTTVWLAAHYMGRSDSRQAVTICDVGKEGRVLRRNRCELVFAARQKKVSTSLEQGLFADLTNGPNLDNPYGVVGLDTAPTLYEGRIPAAFKVTQEVKQWTPQLNRAFFIDAPAPATRLTWDAVTPDTFKSADWPRLVREQLGVGRGFAGSVVVYHQYNAHAILGGGEPLLEEVQDHQRQEPWSFAREVSAFPQRGFFSIVSQISPTGGNNFEDFALLDPTDAKQWLVVAMTKERGEMVMYRRLYIGE